METEEKREYERLDKQVVVHYRQMGNIGDDGHLFTGRMLDCSGGGVRFIGHEQYPKNTHLLLELVFDGWVDEGGEWAKTGNQDDVGLLRSVVGQVMWCQVCGHNPAQFEIGIRFAGMIK